MDELKICDWCKNEFEYYEITKTRLGELCPYCIRAIESRGESVNSFDED